MEYNWKSSSFKNIAEFTTGKLNSNAAVKNGKYPFFTTAPETFTINEWAFDEDAILLGGNNANGIFTLKRYSGKFNAYQRTYVITIKENAPVSIDYLYYALKIKLNLLKSSSLGSATKFLTKGILNDLIIDYPENKLVMEYIASILKNLDNKILLNNKIIANLEEQAQAIFKSWFIDFEPFQDGEFVESELGLIPEGWEIKFIGDICKVSSGKRPLEKTENSGYPIIGANGQTGTNQNYLYNEKVILIGRVGTLGIIQRFNEAIWPSDNTLVFTSDYYEFLHYQLKMIDYSSLNRGSTQPLISQKDIKNIQIVIPSKEIMDSFNGLVSVIFEYIWKLGKESDKLAEIRDTLLPKLMSGEIDVSNINIDAEEECHG